MDVAVGTGPATHGIRQSQKYGIRVQCFVSHVSLFLSLSVHFYRGVFYSYVLRSFGRVYCMVYVPYRIPTVVVSRHLLLY